MFDHILALSYFEWLFIGFVFLIVNELSKILTDLIVKLIRKKFPKKEKTKTEQ